MNTMTTCPQCGATMHTTRRSDGRPRTYCSDTCARRAQQAARDANGVTCEARADDAEFLLQGGLSAPQVASRLGLSLASMGNIMRRAGRPDLARPFERAVKADRRWAA